MAFLILTQSGLLTQGREFNPRVLSLWIWNCYKCYCRYDVHPAIDYPYGRTFESGSWVQFFNDIWLDPYLKVEFLPALIINHTGLSTTDHVRLRLLWLG